ncbi:NADH-quinone oxidoreductase subunit J [Calidifontibacter sp. DB0510]|uniref:NADH-quinone oxidoreductase subunit J n=1 Tax=Metallococcus carri TaxID=1656884 RepID=A0A967AYX4_9MICO|nr:NADH-quinone oxidoreductase subunit J [Metallococcus carri]NHN55238.1 NADH-quinone oxidoreductase subunit J [Metallococcus carri]NOP36315.1 NADH-quinone oxidoreductase subunit J [Calidifontibacter sp. DB2511S]
MTAYDLCFAIVGLLSAASGLLAVTTKHLTHAALWLVVCLGSLAGCYLVLGAELVALVQVLVYVGAVVVLVLFAMMVTRAPIGRSTEHDTSLTQRAAAVVVAASTAVLVGAVLVSLFSGPARRIDVAGTHALATELFGTWVWPFELLSLLLLIAVVTALALTRLRSEAPEDDR